MNLRRGVARLGIASMLLWFVFWTCAYVIHARVSENSPAPPSWSATTEIALLAAAVLSTPWVVLGFRR